MTEPMNFAKYEYAVPVSNEALAESRQTATVLQQWMDATPAERDRWRAEAERERAEVREATARVPLSVDALLEKMLWSSEYAEHLVQPYCECEAGRDGWEYCQYALDLGLAE